MSFQKLPNKQNIAQSGHHQKPLVTVKVLFHFSHSLSLSVCLSVCLSLLPSVLICANQSKSLFLSCSLTISLLLSIYMLYFPWQSWLVLNDINDAICVASPKVAKASTVLVTVGSIFTWKFGRNFAI